jgi:hypothetical protein
MGKQQRLHLKNKKEEWKEEGVKKGER